MAQEQQAASRASGAGTSRGRHRAAPPGGVKIGEEDEKGTVQYFTGQEEEEELVSDSDEEV